MSVQELCLIRQTSCCLKKKIVNERLLKLIVDWLMNHFIAKTGIVDWSMNHFKIAASSSVSLTDLCNEFEPF